MPQRNYTNFEILRLSTSMSTIMTEKAVNAMKGIVMNPKSSKYRVVHETPVEQGARSSGIIL